MPSESEEPPIVSSTSDEGMLREAHDLLRFGVVRWRSSTMAWVASDLIERLAARLPDPADVIDDA